MRSFASDNNAPVHPDVMQAILEANSDHAVGYGADAWTEKALADLRRVFGVDCEPFFVLTGTGANVLSLKAVTRSYHAVLSSENAHLHIDECGAPELLTGAKVMQVPTVEGKINPEALKPFMLAKGFEHASQPRVVSITQCTELGTVYSAAEVEALADFAHENDMLLHMDGARLANAAVALGMELRSCTRDLGVDILSFGATKNGLMCGEAVIFFDPALAEDFKYMRKQSMQLLSKMRYVSAQFSALLQNSLWRSNAAHANRMAARLGETLQGFADKGVALTRDGQSNHVFATLPPESIPALQEEFYFYVWNPLINECRFVTSWDTSEEDIAAFAAAMRRILG